MRACATHGNVAGLTGRCNLPDCGAPSCDSPELAAIRIRARNPDKDTCRTIDRDALLRMVDELTKKNSELRKGQVKYMTEQGAFLLSANEKNVDLATRNLELKEERDDLRAKLEERDREVSEQFLQLNERMVESNELRAKLAQRDHLLSDREKARYELEVKLAEAEKQADRWNGECAAQRERAEAAEARVRELEGMLQKFSPVRNARRL